MAWFHLFFPIASAYARKLDFRLSESPKQDGSTRTVDD
jgi:hypothetical protein